MAERRSLVAGLEVLPEGVEETALRSFITQEKPKTQMVSVPEAGEGSDDPEPSAPSSSRKVNKTTPAKRGKVLPLHANILVPVTVRLKPEIADALKRASLQRQLNGLETYTQQDIVEDALVPWLKAEGLLE